MNRMSKTCYGMLFATRNPEEVFDRFADEIQLVLDSASSRLHNSVTVNLDDAGVMKSVVSGGIDVIYTSPPYCNRMSYIRELRPYMYWLGYLSSGKQAGDMDWKAIGGTWGSATSRLSSWDCAMPLPIGGEFESIFRKISDSGGRNAQLMANYVHKYFFDMLTHFRSAYRVMRKGGRLTYIVGNSTFYGVTVPTEQWYLKLMEHVGFENVKITAIRKRNSNRKLFEFTVECVRR